MVKLWKIYLNNKTYRYQNIGNVTNKMKNYYMIQKINNILIYFKWHIKDKYQHINRDMKYYKIVKVILQL